MSIIIKYFTRSAMANNEIYYESHRAGRFSECIIQLFSDEDSNPLLRFRDVTINHSEQPILKRHPPPPTPPHATTGELYLPECQVSDIYLETGYLNILFA